MDGDPGHRSAIGCDDVDWLSWWRALHQTLGCDAGQDARLPTQAAGRDGCKRHGAAEAEAVRRQIVGDVANGQEIDGQGTSQRCGSSVDR